MLHSRNRTTDLVITRSMSSNVLTTSRIPFILANSFCRNLIIYDVIKWYLISFEESYTLYNCISHSLCMIPTQIAMACSSSLIAAGINHSQFLHPIINDIIDLVLHLADVE